MAAMLNLLRYMTKRFDRGWQQDVRADNYSPFGGIGHTFIEIVDTYPRRRYLKYYRVSHGDDHGLVTSPVIEWLLNPGIELSGAMDGTAVSRMRRDGTASGIADGGVSTSKMILSPKIKST
ncbi:hypothetical protein E4U55_004317 [Claviceps digitariae]|nr:hypothetical protein E4U55_004317 [Claviceps digitariae]